jgi:CheY-like chemotaxis protein
MAISALFNRRILIVEDDPPVAMSLRNVLKIIGAEVVGPVHSIERAIGAIESEPDIDAAIVDADLGGVMAYPVADRLIARNIPFVFASGYGVHALRARYPQIASFHKPYVFEILEKALSSAMLGKDEAQQSFDAPKNRARG